MPSTVVTRGDNAASVGLRPAPKLKETTGGEFRVYRPSIRLL